MEKTKKKEKNNENTAKMQAPQAVAQIFSLTRDIDVLNPYHLDGDVEMYDQEILKLRQQLRKDKDILKQIQQITKLYKWEQQEKLRKIVCEGEYKHIQRLLALILRPEIDKQQLQFVVDQDWEHDKIKQQNKQFISIDKLIDAIWELIDVWTSGATKQQYISFCRLLRKKLQRALKAQK